MNTDILKEDFAHGFLVRFNVW